MSDKKTFAFNINDIVQVKLTDRGRYQLRKNRDDFWADIGREPPHAYAPPKEDADGWSSWQLWYLMAQLGKQCGAGLPLPFETTIRIQAKDLEARP